MSELERKLSEVLSTIVERWEDAPTNPTPTSRNGKISTPRAGSKPPVAAHILDLRATARTILVGWCHVLHDEQDVPLPATTGTRSIAAHLLRNVTMLALDEHTGESALGELRDITRGLNMTPPPTRDQCVKCGRHTAEWAPRWQRWWCTSCDHTWTPIEAAQRVTQASKGAILTLGQMADLSEQLLGGSYTRQWLHRIVKQRGIVADRIGPRNTPMYSVNKIQQNI